MNSISESKRIGARQRAEKRASLADLFGGDSPAPACSWAWAYPDDLVAAVVSWTTRGGAIVLGTTSDGGALSVTLLQDGERFKLYAANKDELSRLLTQIRDVG
jgi:hypothetical protein